MVDAIRVQGLSKRYRRANPNRPWTLQELVLSRFRNLRLEDTFWALKDISFRVAPGRMVGVIGRNGAGKSTLLRLIGGVGRPDKGSIEVNGKLGALIELGAGFHPDLTGRENVFINGVISGLTRSQITDRFNDIVQFAELEDFIDNPLRTYSTGMHMRLAFSIAAHVDPQVLLVDEVLAVGDLGFQQKCLDRIAEFQRCGCAILLVSHDTTLISQICDEALWLEAGQLAAFGPAQAVANQYLDALRGATRSRTPLAGPARKLPAGGELRLNENRFGSLEMEITAVHLSGEDKGQATVLNSGSPLQVVIQYRAPQTINNPIFGVSLSREDGLTIYDTSTSTAGLRFPTLQGEGIISLILERLDLVAGRYYVDVGVYQADWEYAYDYHWHAYPIQVQGSTGEKGILRPPHSWQHDHPSLPTSGLPKLHAQ